MVNKEKRINSKAKGNRFENQICKLLNERFKTKDFCRSPGSGAFATTHSLPDYLKVYGDIITISNFKFVTECKKGYSYIRLGNILSYTTEFQSFIEQAKRDAIASGREWMVIFKQDRLPTIALTKTDFPCKTSLKYINEEEVINIYPFEEILQADDFYWLSRY